jgi:hypothetical protein
MAVGRRRSAHRLWAFLIGVAAIALAVGVSGRDARADGAWLDAPLANWNQPGAAIPRAPRPSEP